MRKALTGNRGRSRSTELHEDQTAMNINQTERPLPFDMDEPMIWTVGNAPRPVQEATEKPRESGYIGRTLRVILRMLGRH